VTGGRSTGGRETSGTVTAGVVIAGTVTVGTETLGRVEGRGLVGTEDFARADPASRAG
jgi:hypothetical protein